MAMMNSNQGKQIASTGKAPKLTGIPLGTKMKKPKTIKPRKK